jgi:hypothetical protein
MRRSSLVFRDFFFLAVRTVQNWTARPADVDALI